MKIYDVAVSSNLINDSNLLSCLPLIRQLRCSRWKSRNKTKNQTRLSKPQSRYFLPVVRVVLAPNLHEFDARLERIVEAEEKQKVLLHGQKLSELSNINFAVLKLVFIRTEAIKSSEKLRFAHYCDLVKYQTQCFKTLPDCRRKPRGSRILIPSAFHQSTPAKIRESV